MKAVNFMVLVLTILFVSTPCFSKKVDLYGHWAHIKKSTIIDIPIEASFEEGSKELYLQFQDNFGIVNIVVTNSIGNIIRTEIVQITEMESVTIPLNDISKGEYVLSISNSTNNVYGKFLVY